MPESPASVASRTTLLLHGAPTAPIQGNPRQPAADDLLGSTIDGRYEVQALLGTGGMGAVYRVRHTSLGRPLALKILHERLAYEAALAARFTHEARTMGQLDHPGIVEVIDFGRLANGRPYFVMELLEGPSLSSALGEGPLPLRRTLDIARQIAEALAHAHGRGVVHRDLKPDNIQLLPVNRDGERIKLLDFGLAQVADAARFTAANVVLGTPHYMSPEQCTGAPVDARSDLYALGIILYEMVTGRVPFEASVNAAVWAMHMGVAPAAPSSLRPQLRELPALEQLILRCLAKSPLERPQSAAAFLADLKRVEAQLERGPETDPQFALTSAPPPPLPKQPLWPKLVAVGAALALLVALTTLAGARKRGTDGGAVAAASAVVASNPPASAASPQAGLIPKPAPVAADDRGQTDEKTRNAPAVASSGPPRPSPLAANPGHRLKRPTSNKPKRIQGGELYDPWAR